MFKIGQIQKSSNQQNALKVLHQHQPSIAKQEQPKLLAQQYRPLTGRQRLKNGVVQILPTQVTDGSPDTRVVQHN